jgi:site-specific recombinase XerD
MSHFNNTADLRVNQKMLGHASIGTYVSSIRL